MDYVFFSGHHRHTHEMVMRCHEVGARLLLPPHDTQESFKHYAGRNLIPQFGLDRYGVESLESIEALRGRVEKGEIGGFFISLPEHVPMLREHFGDVPIAADHMVNYYDEFREAGLRNFMSPDRRALDRMDAPNQLHSVKVRDFDFIESVVDFRPRPAARRSGFYSYINRYEKRWKRAYAMFSTIENHLAGSIDVSNFGTGNPNGEVLDLPHMHRSKASIHIKDAHVCCTAVIDSISVGTPVLVDDESMEILGLEDYVIHMVSGIRFKTVDEAISWIKVLDEDDNLLDELSLRTREFARTKLRNTTADTERFRAFLNRLS